MSKFNNRKIIPRYSVIAIAMSLFSVAILSKAVYTMTAKRNYWMEVSSKQKKTVSLSHRFEETFSVLTEN